jgi:hypothetical protein
MSKYKIVMVRHGESEWNQLNLFCGWFDADLSDKGNIGNCHARISCRKLFRVRGFGSRFSIYELGSTQFESRPYTDYPCGYFSVPPYAVLIVPKKLDHDRELPHPRQSSGMCSEFLNCKINCKFLVFRGCRVVSAADPHSSIIGFLGRSRYYFK